MIRKELCVAIISSTMLLSSVNAEDSLRSTITVPDATKQLDKDKIDSPTKYTMPSGCIKTDKISIQRGKFFFHNLSGKQAKKKKEYLATIGIDIKSKHKDLMKPYGGWQPYGNCVACHNTPGAIGAGNIGPNLTGYSSWGRSDQFIYQKISDPRIDNPMTHMPIGLTTKRLFNEQEVCDIVSYLKTL